MRLHKKISGLALLLVLLAHCAYPQGTTDTLSRYDGGVFLVKNPTGYMLANSGGMIDHWETVAETIRLSDNSYQVVKRKDGDKWKTGLFRRKDGTLLLHTDYEVITSFFDAPSLLAVKGSNGFFLYSPATGARTSDGFETLKRFGKDGVAFNATGLFIYNDQLQIKDSTATACRYLKQLDNGSRRYIVLGCSDGIIMIDDKYQHSTHPGWANIITVKGNLLIVEGSKGAGVYSLALGHALTSYDHQANVYELYPARFALFRAGHYILYDSTGKTLATVKADGLSPVEELRAFFYHRENAWKIMGGDGRPLATPAFDDFDQDKAPVGQFTARVKGEKKYSRYAWQYAERNGEKTITGIKLVGGYKDNGPVPAAAQPVEIKSNQ